MFDRGGVQKRHMCQWLRSSYIEIIMWRPGSRRGGKTTMLQPFHQQHVEKWMKHAKEQQVVGLLMDVWGGKTAHAQFSCLKKLVVSVSQLAGSGSLSGPFLLVLVEMHAVCLSRHPLQRAIASLLQGLPDPYGGTVVDHIHSTIDAALAGGWLASDTHCLQYLEALGENFPLGELALWKQLPLVVKYCVSVIEVCYSHNGLTDPLFTTALKTIMTILHKTQSLVCGLLSGEFSFQFPSSTTEAVVSWAPEQRSWSAELRVQWFGGLLARTSNLCEALLKTGVGVPHDLCLTAAMVLVVIILRTRTSSEDRSAVVTDITSDWLRTTGSPLKDFSQLAVCHALLAKLPLSALFGDAGGKPCLLKLFPKICHLFDGFTETSDRYIAARTLALWTTMAKQCASDICEGNNIYEALLPSGPSINLVLKKVWTLWEDPVDGIRHQCKLMFENVIGICQRLQKTESLSPSPFLLSLVDSLLALSSPTRGKYQLLSTLSHTHPCHHSPPHCPNPPY
ncbi:Thyroid adenoma-associated protein [Geodia barretti]|uniref:Thyroid adenoma-associated protein n=1 Tax=Geodia barretti TaxID=519541 RepID=A0AA35S697_GEOBA|nr:Thyroid adenoma-associated protein [Geodia barretti]